MENAGHAGDKPARIEPRRNPNKYCKNIQECLTEQLNRTYNKTKLPASKVTTARELNWLLPLASPTPVPKVAIGTMVPVDKRCDP